LLAWQPMGAAPSVESTADGGLLLSGSSIAFMSDGATTTLEALLKPSSSPGSEEMLSRMEKLEQRVADLEAENAALKAQDTAFTTQVGELKQANVEQDLASDAQGAQFGATVEIVKQSVQSVSEELDSTVEELGTLADAAEARSTCLADISERAGGKADETCPNADDADKNKCVELDEIKGGTLHGNGREVGAARYYTCNDGYVIVGKSHVFCGKDLEWTPSIPSCVAEVTCYGKCDDNFLGVYADGKGVSIQTVARIYNNDGLLPGLRYWKFPATAKVLGIKAYDGQCGCNCGQVFFSCTTAVDSPWNGVSSGDHNVQILGSEEKDKIARSNSDWATDSDKATALKVDEWPKASVPKGLRCLEMDPDYLKGVCDAEPGSNTECKTYANFREKYHKACEGDYSDATAEITCADEDAELNDTPTGLKVYNPDTR